MARLVLLLSTDSKTFLLTSNAHVLCRAARTQLCFLCLSNRLPQNLLAYNIKYFLSVSVGQ